MVIAYILYVTGIDVCFVGDIERSTGYFVCLRGNTI